MLTPFDLIHVLLIFIDVFDTPLLAKILSQFQLVSEEDYILYKYKQGVPEGSDFISHVSLPLEVNLDFLNGDNL
ncbi:hypothetical protein HMI55_001290 [Coelomomyces lativittatus]|nr:hypothetical protein HMI55_001290 [Coelomomyces lativittatus]